MDANEMLEKIKGGAIVSTAWNRAQMAAVLGGLMKDRKLGVYLTTAKPHARVVESLKEGGVDCSSLFFLDMAGKQNANDDNVFMIKDPGDLTELSIIITEVMESEEISFLVLDTISGLEAYASLASIKQLLGAITTYTKRMNKAIIICYDEKENEEMVRFIRQISDYS